jgi:hypothetical protein
MVASWKVAGAALLLFGSGVLTGFLLREGRLNRSHDIRPLPTTAAIVSPAASSTNSPRTRNLARPPGWQRFEAIRRLESEVQLSDAQRDSIREMIRISEDRIRSEWEPVVPRIQSEVRELRRRISSELSDEQRQRFDTLLDRRDPANPTRGQRRTNTTSLEVNPPPNP